MKAIQIPIVPLQGTTPFPGCASVFEADREYMERVQRHIENGQQVALVKWNDDGSKEPTVSNLSPIGVLARIAVLPFVDSKVIVAVEGSEAIAINEIVQTEDGVLEGKAQQVHLQITTKQQQAG